MYTWREHIELYHMLWKTNFKGSRWVSEIVLEHLILVNSPSFALSPLRISVCSFDHRLGGPVNSWWELSQREQSLCLYVSTKQSGIEQSWQEEEPTVPSYATAFNFLLAQKFALHLWSVFFQNSWEIVYLLLSTDSKTTTKLTWLKAITKTILPV